MRHVTKFIAKFASLIVACLSCFDRVIFKGYLPFGDNQHFDRWVDGWGYKRKDFLPLVKRMSQRLVEHAQAEAIRQGARYEYLQGRVNKQRLIDKLLRERRIEEGLIAVLCCQETCRTVKLLFGRGRPRLVFTRRPQRVRYYFFPDPEFGRIHVRLRTWFPFTIQVYVNGHDWLARQMSKKRMGFVQHDNAFTQLDDAPAAQKHADRFLAVGWRGQLNRWAKVVNTLLRERGSLVRGAEYRWFVDQAEYSTDVIFASPEKAVMQRANQRYLNALSVVADPTPAHHHVGELIAPKQAGSRRIAGFNPARRADVRLFRAVLQGDHLVKGFYNRYIRNLLYPAGDDEAVDAKTLRRQRAAVGRQLHVRGLIAKIPDTRRWQVTARGHQLLGACVQLYYYGLATAT